MYRKLKRTVTTAADDTNTFTPPTPTYIPVKAIVRVKLPILCCFQQGEWPQPSKNEQRRPQTRSTSVCVYVTAAEALARLILIG